MHLTLSKLKAAALLASTTTVTRRAKLKPFASESSQRHHGTKTKTTHFLSILAAILVACTLLLPATAQTVTPTPTVSPSTLCKPGWSYYDDSGGTEGKASCLQVTGTTSASWTAALTACPLNSHLLTISGTSTAGLLTFSTTLSTANFWVGASQISTATSRNRGWAWYDGTSAAANLNCGTVDTLGCGLWHSVTPE